MKIVFVGNFRVDFSSESHHAKSLETLGHEVLRLQETVATREKILEEGLKSDMVVFIHTHSWETKGDISWTELSKQLKEAGVPFVTYHLDLWFGIGREKDLDDEYYKSLHHFFTVDKLMADWLNEHTDVKGHYLPAGVYDKECVMLSHRNVGYDIVFAGSRNYHKEYPYRHELIDFLRQTYGQQFLHVGNDGEVGQKRGLALNQIYADAKIVIGDSLNIGFNYPYYWSDRVYETTGRGGFMIHPQIEGIQDEFETLDFKTDDGMFWDKAPAPVELVTYEYGNFQMLKDRINYFLKEETYREDIRRAGFERTKRDHTYLNRWQTILDTVKNNNEV